MSIQDKIQNNMKNKNSYGVQGKRTLEVSDDIEFYKPEAGTIKIDILLYRTGTNHHPDGTKKGEEDYVLSYWQHSNVGPGDDTFLCLKNTFGKPCPICEERELMKKNGSDKDSIKALYPKRRVLYNIIDLDDKEKGIQLFSVSHFLFEKELLGELQAIEKENGEFVCFPDFKDGRTLKIRVREEKADGYSYMKFTKFDLIKREKPYNPKMIEKTYPLDTFLIIPSYNEVKNAFFYNMNELEENTDNDFEEHPFENETEIQSKEEIQENKCPYGYVFGKDTNEYDECTDCNIWDKCTS